MLASKRDPETNLLRIPTGKSLKDTLTFLAGWYRGYAVWDQVVPCRRYDREQPIRVYKDTELERGECVPICQWESQYSKPRHYIHAPLATLLHVNVRIGNDHFKFKFKSKGEDKTIRSEFHFAATPRFQKVHVIGQGGFGTVWKCQVRFSPSHWQ